MYIVGYVVKPHGIKGEIKISPVSPKPERFKYLKKIYIRKDSLDAYSIRNVRIANRFVYLQLAQVETRTQAEELRDCEVLVEDSQAIELESDEYFIHDLIGCAVFSEEGKRIGTITDVWQNAGNDIYVVTDRNEMEILLPAIKDVVKSVEIENKKVVIRLIEGLTE